MRRLSVFAIIFIFAFVVIPNAVLADDPIVEVISPNGGEVVSVGHTVTIAWNASDVDGDLDSFDIQYNKSGGGWIDIDLNVAGGPDGSFEYEWEVPDDVSDEVLIAVSAFQAGDAVADVSDGVFEITKRNPEVHVTYPDGSEVLRWNDLIQITFEVNDPGGANEINLNEAYYTINDGYSWNFIASSDGDDFDIFWTIPEFNSSDCRVKVVSTDHTGLVGEAESHSNFTLTGPSESEQHFAPGWSLMSFPVIPDPDHNTIEEIFGDDFHRLFVVYGWSPDRGHFVPEVIEHGQAYFLGGTQDATVDIVDYDVYAEATHELELVRGWNMFGTPWFQRVDLLDAVVTVGLNGDAMSFEDAVDFEITGPVGYNFFHNTPDELLPGQELQRYFEHQELLPWRGYWYMALVDSVVVTIEPTGAFPTPMIDGADDATPDNWHIDFIGLAGETADVCRVGSRETATAGFNPVHDWPQPPDAPVENPIRLYFDHGAWAASAGQNFSRDIRAPFAQGATDEWTITVSTVHPTEVTIYWPEVSETIPSGNGTYFEVSITDTETNEVINLRENESYTFDANGERDFIVHVESPLSVEDKNSTLPNNFGISAIYPNPFNSTTVVNYQINNSANVKLALFDLAGREVAVLAQGNVSAGSYTSVVSGASFESGVYLLHLTSGGQSQTEKLTLIK